MDFVRTGNYDFIPCSVCLSCRILKSREWSNRLACELQSWDYAYFITLTYDENNIPVDVLDSHYLTNEVNVEVPVVRSEDVKKFIQRFRYRFGDCVYFYSAEYGTKTHRPHYHLVLFTDHEFQITDFNYLYLKNDGTVRELEDLWSLGHIRVADVIPERLKYVAGYTQKKYLLKKTDWRGRHAEFVSMSKKVPIGFEYFYKNKEKIMELDQLTPPVPVGTIRVPNAFLRYGLRHGLLSDSEVDNIKKKRQRSLYSFYKKNPDYLERVAGKNLELSRQLSEKVKKWI